MLRTRTAQLFVCPLWLLLLAKKPSTSSLLVETEMASVVAMNTLAAMYLTIDVGFIWLLLLSLLVVLVE